jgi:hypothetical protein
MVGDETDHLGAYHRLLPTLSLRRLGLATFGPIGLNRKSPTYSGFRVSVRCHERTNGRFQQRLHNPFGRRSGGGRVLRM